MNESQKRAYIFLHAEIQTFTNLRDKDFVIYEMIGRVSLVLQGQKIDQGYYNLAEEAKLLQETTKILHLTDMPLEDMIAVLEKLAELWKPRY